MKNRFPLLRLPSAVLTKVLKSMEKLDQISISFISNRTKALVTCLNIHIDISVLKVSHRLSFQFMFDLDLITFILCQENNNAPLTIINPVQVVFQEVSYWRKEGYGIRDWIDHLMVIANTPMIHSIWFSGEGAAQINFASIKHVIQGLDIMTLNTSHCSTDYQQTVLEAFPMRNIAISRIPYPNPEKTHNILMRNYDNIGIEFLTTELKLNELLTMNSRAITITSSHNTDILQILNPFLKLWKCGSNPRMEYFRFYDVDEILTPDVIVILKGIRHQVVPNKVVRELKLPIGSQIVEGGFDIQGLNGRRATVHIITGLCEVFVWLR